MLSDFFRFNGSTRIEVMSVIASCGRDTHLVKEALVKWIQHKQDKGRSTEHILEKLETIEVTFIHDIRLHAAFREARDDRFLPGAPYLNYHPPGQRGAPVH